MLKSSLILISALLISVLGNGQTEHQENWKTLETDDYSIRYPSDWNMDNSGNAGYSFMLYSQLKGEDDTYSDYISLNIQSQVGLNISLSDFTKRTESDIPFFYQKATILDSGRDKKSGEPCSVLTYSGNMADFPLSFHQYIWMVKEHAYILTFTSEQQSFDEMKAIATQIMDTFQFKDSAKN